MYAEANSKITIGMIIALCSGALGYFVYGGAGAFLGILVGSLGLAKYLSNLLAVPRSTAIVRVLDRGSFLGECKDVGFCQHSMLIQRYWVGVPNGHIRAVLP